MSWQDRIEKLMTITTGDGQDWEVIWKNPRKAIEWNGAEFPFIGVAGVYARKRKLLGRKFPLEFFFQGEDHLQTAKLFERAADDPRPWVVQHPYYDTIICQVFSLEIDDTSLNVTRVTGTAIETITEDGTRFVKDPVDAVQLKQASLQLSLENELTTEPTIQDVNTLQQNLSNYHDEGAKIISLPEEAEEYINAFNEAASYVNVITASPILAMRAMVSFLTLPARFTADVKNRIEVMLQQFEILRRTLSSVVKVPSKQLYESQGAALISSLCAAAVTPLSGNYNNATSAVTIAEQILEAHQQFLEDLDELQSPNGGSPLYFVPGFEVMNQLNEVVNLTVSALVGIALNGRMERTVTLQYDSNLILVTHRFYGLDGQDANLEEMIENNGFTYKDIALGLKKGTKIVYYK